MKKGWIIFLGIILIVGAIFFSTNILKEEAKEIDKKQEIVPQVVESNEINFQEYNYQFVEGEKIERILDNLIGSDGKVEFYLPPTGYIDVNRASSFGVAFAINNPQPSGNNYFEYEFTPDESTLISCGVDMESAKNWISMGQKSFGKIQKGWIDKMTVYFVFNGVPKPCTAKYNFEVRKDGEIYSTKQLVFNLI